MRKPKYKYPDFVSEVKLESGNGKRYWLKLKIDKNKTDGIIVILKNPSLANETVSDKTVVNVSNYIYSKRDRKDYPELNNVGEIIILNLIPYYMTKSNRLQEFKDNIIDSKNIKIINDFCSKIKNVIIAWGNHPDGLFEEYEKLKKETMKIFTKNQNHVFHVGRLSNQRNPKHGLVWNSKDELNKLTIQ